MQTRHYQSKSTARRWILLGSFLVLIFSAYLSSTSIYAETNSEVQFAANVLDVISLELSGTNLTTDTTTGAQTLTLPMQPISGGYFGSSMVNAKVFTNNDTGYRLTLKTGSLTNALVNKDDTSLTIPTLESDVVVNTLDGTGFPEDRWGYTLDTASPYSFTGILDPTSTYPAAMIANIGTAVPLGDTTPVTFATRVSLAKPAGTYTNNVVFTATVDPVAEGVEPPLPTPAFYTLTTMQGMDATICASVNTPPNTATSWADSAEAYNMDLKTNSSTTLIPRTMLEDTRDHHWYIVSKLADGNCWMTENLALSSGTTEATRRTITSTDSNVTANYELPMSETLKTSGTTNKYLNNSSAFSDNNVEYMYNGDALTYNYSQHSNTGTNGYGEYRNTRTHTGSFYSWPAATAGEGKDGAIAAEEDATQDICPKGWQLPSGGASGTNKQFEVLYRGNPLGYNNPSGDTNKNYFDIAFNNKLSSDATTAWFAGYWASGSLTNSGSNAIWWSRTSGRDTVAHDLYESSNYVGPTYTDFRRSGYFVRCLAK